MNAHVSDGDIQVRQGSAKPKACMTPVLSPSPPNPPPAEAHPVRQFLCVIGCTVVGLAVGQPDHCLICVPPTEAIGIALRSCVGVEAMGVAWVGGNE